MSVCLSAAAQTHYNNFLKINTMNNKMTKNINSQINVFFSQSIDVVQIWCSFIKPNYPSENKLMVSSRVSQIKSKVKYHFD